LVDMEEFESWILYEDDHILVINKPGWLVCHPSKNGPLSSLVGASKEYLGIDTLHLASRLDRETSGVVLLAKHRKSAGYWQKGIEKKRICRSYLAIVEGKFQRPRKFQPFWVKIHQAWSMLSNGLLKKAENQNMQRVYFLRLSVTKGTPFVRFRP